MKGREPLLVTVGVCSVIRARIYLGPQEVNEGVHWMEARPLPVPRDPESRQEPGLPPALWTTCTPCSSFSLQNFFHWAGHGPHKPSPPGVWNRIPQSSPLTRAAHASLARTPHPPCQMGGRGSAHTCWGGGQFLEKEALQTPPNRHPQVQGLTAKAMPSLGCCFMYLEGAFTGWA